MPLGVVYLVFRREEDMRVGIQTLLIARVLKHVYKSDPLRLLADVRHWCDFAGQSFPDVLTQSQSLYEEDKACSATMPLGQHIT